MRKTFAFTAPVLLLLAAFNPVSTQAQFLKQLLNNVKQTAQNRANGKADQATNKSLDKVDTSSNPLAGRLRQSPRRQSQRHFLRRPDHEGPWHFCRWGRSFSCGLRYRNP